MIQPTGEPFRLEEATIDDLHQAIRVDAKDSSPRKLVFNRIVTLRDTWAKISGKEKR